MLGVIPGYPVRVWSEIVYPEIPGGWVCAVGGRGWVFDGGIVGW
jgi:hypothetical protein